jgi:hypothetical protein
MGEMLVNIAAGLLTSVVGFGLGAIFTRIRFSRRLGHIERLMPADRKVQVVLPSASVGDFDIKGEPGSRANAVQITLSGQASSGIGRPGWRVIRSVGRLTR